MNQTLSQADLDFIQKLPKAELHVHLRGSTPIQLMQDLIETADFDKLWQEAGSDTREAILASKHIETFVSKLQNSEPFHVKDLFEYDQFRDFLRTYFFTGMFFKSLDSFTRLVNGVLEDLKKQNVHYAEIIVSVPEYIMSGLKLEDVLQVLDDSKKDAPIEVNYIVDLVRNFGAAKAEALLEKIAHFKPKSIVGITLGGNEEAFPPEMFVDLYSKAREMDWNLTLHSGEFKGADSVDFAIENLKPKRLGHGVRSIEDPRVLDKIVERQIPLEVCITSNLFLGLYKTVAEHPAHRLFKAGALVTLNSDDPTFFHTDLCNEYACALQNGFTRDELVEVAKNGFRCGVLSESRVGEVFGE